MFDFASMTDAQKVASFDWLVARGHLDEGYLLSDFSSTLEHVLETEIRGLEQPVFTNPITGKSASSMHAIFLALGYNYTQHWSILCRHLEIRGRDAVFMRDDEVMKEVRA